MYRTVVAAGLCAALSACSQSDVSGSGFLGASGSAKIAPPTVTQVSDPAAPRTGRIDLPDGGGARYDIAIDPDAGPTVSANLMPGTRDVTPPQSGRATMTGKFGLLKLENARRTDGVWSGETTAIDGDISLTARFGAGTLRGGGDGLNVDGRIADGGLEGLVSYDGIQAGLDGIINADHTVGVFYGGGTGRGMAGGFVAVAD